MKRGLFFIFCFSFMMLIGSTSSTYCAENNYSYQLKKYINSDEYQDMLKSLPMEEDAKLEVMQDSDNEIDEAYERVQNEEKYIVDLINRFDSDEHAIQESWESNLNWLIKNHEMLKQYKKEDIRMDYVDSYIEAYKTVLMDKNLPDEKVEEKDTFKLFNNEVFSTRDYSRDDAVKYAKKYYKNYNSNYPDWGNLGGDCANFVSQCLHAGGKSMVKGEATSFAYWFSSGNTTDTNKVSSTWRGADAFRHFWQSNASKYKKFTSYDGMYAYGFKGDAATFLTPNGRGYHTVIIVDYDTKNKDLVYAAHTISTKSGSLKSAIKSKNIIIYNMK